MSVGAHPIDLGGARRLLVTEPAGAPTSIVLSLHGSRSRPDHQLRLSRMAAYSAVGAIVAFPQGSMRSGGGWEWDLQADVEALDRIVEDLRERYRAATAPLCVSGMSGGARMASRFASLGRAQVNVVGAVAGLRMPAVQDLERPVRVVAFHGTRDRINPYGGGNTPRWRESVLDAAAGWARANGHSPEPTNDEITPALTRLSYGSPDDPGAVTLWVCERAGHTWPGTRLTLGLRLFLGRISYDVDASAEIWRALSVS